MLQPLGLVLPGRQCHGMLEHGWRPRLVPMLQVVDLRPRSQIPLAWLNQEVQTPFFSDRRSFAQDAIDAGKKGVRPLSAKKGSDQVRPLFFPLRMDV